MKRWFAAMFVAMAALVASHMPAVAEVLTYNDFSRMDDQVTGQLCDMNDNCSVSWRWAGGYSSAREINWGPGNFERFTHDNQWVYLHGYHDGQGTEYNIKTWYTTVTENKDCSGAVTVVPTNGGPQPYAKWIIPALGNGYCMESIGTLHHSQYPAIVWVWRHKQKFWYEPDCWHHWHAKRHCLRKDEEYWSNAGGPNGAAYGEYRLQQDRTDWLAPAGGNWQGGIGWYLEDHKTGWTARGLRSSEY